MAKVTVEENNLKDISEAIAEKSGAPVSLKVSEMGNAIRNIQKVQSDWNEADPSAESYIKNKPSSMPASDVKSWAKSSNKPSYNASEVGALPISGGQLTGITTANNNTSYTTP